MHTNGQVLRIETILLGEKCDEHPATLNAGSIPIRQGTFMQMRPLGCEESPLSRGDNTDLSVSSRFRTYQDKIAEG